MREREREFCHFLIFCSGYQFWLPAFFTSDWMPQLFLQVVCAIVQLFCLHSATSTETLLSPLCNFHWNSSVSTLQLPLQLFCLYSTTSTATLLSPLCNFHCNSSVSTLQLPLQLFCLHSTTSTATLLSPLYNFHCNSSVSTLQLPLQLFCLHSSTSTATLLSPLYNFHCNSCVSTYVQLLCLHSALSPGKPMELTTRITRENPPAAFVFLCRKKNQGPPARTGG